MNIQPYLFFSGRCEEAIEFYRKAIGAEVDMVLHFNESPAPMPPGVLQEGFEAKVMHASFRVGDATILCSDGCDDKTAFSGFSLALYVSTEADADRAFGALAEEGEVQMPLAKTFWSPRYGMVKDKFGISWMVMVPAAVR
jgi:PhnB protein